MNTSIGTSRGSPAARIFSASPMRRKISMLRAFTRSILGRNCGASFCSMSVQRTPRKPRSTASVSPTGPAPTMRTWVSILALTPHSRLSSRRRRGPIANGVRCLTGRATLQGHGVWVPACAGTTPNVYRKLLADTYFSMHRLAAIDQQCLPGHEVARRR